VGAQNKTPLKNRERKIPIKAREEPSARALKFWAYEYRFPVHRAGGLAMSDYCERAYGIPADRTEGMIAFATNQANADSKPGGRSISEAGLEI
jgi:hypothetical protein